MDNSQNNQTNKNEANNPNKVNNPANPPNNSFAKKEEPEKLHPAVVSKDILKNSGKEVGLVDPPIVSVAPSSGKKSSKVDVKKLSDVSVLIGDDDDEDYPYDELEIEQGFFIPTQPNNTTDALLAEMQKSIENAKQRYGQIEVNREGDEIWEQLTVRTKKRNEDGTIQLEGGKPILGADFFHRPKYIYTRNFIVKPVVKGEKIGKSAKADGDGVVVIRVA